MKTEIERRGKKAFSTLGCSVARCHSFSRRIFRRSRRANKQNICLGIHDFTPDPTHLCLSRGSGNGCNGERCSLLSASHARASTDASDLLIVAAMTMTVLLMHGLSFLPPLPGNLDLSCKKSERKAGISIDGRQ